MALLPPEITDRIIDFLHNEPKELYACCLVCREWVPSSRTHLFWTISLPKLRQTAFLRLLEFTPQVGLYVRVLLVDCKFRLSDHERLVDLCLLLKNLSKLHITAYSMRSGVLVALWSSLPCLKELSLTISGTFRVDPGDRPLITSTKIQSLRTVILGSKFFKWSIQRNIFPQIRSFEHVDSDEMMSDEKMEDVISLYKFLKQCCLSLVHVRLDYLRHNLSEQLFDCLGLLVNLQNLFVQVYDLQITTSRESDERIGWRISDIPRFLDCITSRSLMSISWGIEFAKPDWFYYDVEGMPSFEFDSPGFTQMWEEVCQMLVAPRFSTVKTVVLCVGTDLFDNQQRYFRPLLALGENGRVKLLWVNPHADEAAAEYWRRMVLPDS